MRNVICFVCLLFSINLLGFAQNRSITLPARPERLQYVDYPTRNVGWWCSAQLSGGIATTNDDTHNGYFQIDFVNGYRFSEFLKVGIGIAPRFYSSDEQFPLCDDKLIFGIYSLPIFAAVRGNFISQEDRMLVPYWSVNTGFAVNEGAFLSPCVGIRYGGRRHDILLGVTYTLQGHTVDEFNAAVHLFSVNIGYEF